MALSDEQTIDAKLEELDRLIADLEKRRQELREAKESIMAERALLPPKQRQQAVASRVPGRLEKAAAEGHSTEASEVAARLITAALERTLDSLSWKSFKKREGEWTFLRDTQGRLADELESSKDFIDLLRKDGEIVVGKYRYRVSEDRFLNRYFAGTKK